MVKQCIVICWGRVWSKLVLFQFWRNSNFTFLDYVFCIIEHFSSFLAKNSFDKNQFLLFAKHKYFFLHFRITNYLLQLFGNLQIFWCPRERQNCSKIYFTPKRWLRWCIRGTRNFGRIFSWSKIAENMFLFKSTLVERFVLRKI